MQNITFVSCSSLLVACYFYYFYNSAEYAYNHKNTKQNKLNGLEILVLKFYINIKIWAHRNILWIELSNCNVFIIFNSIFIWWTRHIPFNRYIEINEHINDIIIISTTCFISSICFYVEYIMKLLYRILKKHI